MEINGVDLFVAEYGAATAPPLLFIHGHGGGYPTTSTFRPSYWRRASG